MMKNICILFQFLSRIFSPSYIYTLDKSFLGENKNSWVFKEFGTHTYIMKTWQQLQDGHFIRELNPKDILYITQVETRRQMENKYLRICEEKIDDVYILSCEDI